MAKGQTAGGNWLMEKVEALIGRVSKIEQDVSKQNSEIGTSEQLVVANNSNASMVNLDYSKYRKIGVALYENTMLVNLYSYSEIPLDIFKNFTQANGGTFRTTYKDDIVFARYISDTKIGVWLNTDATNNSRCGILYGIK